MNKIIHINTEILQYKKDQVKKSEAQEEKNDVAQKFMLYFILFRNIWIATECFRFTLTLFEK